MKDFKEFLVESKEELNEAKYFTLPDKVVGNELFVLQRELSEFYKSVKKGNDVNMNELKKMKTMMDKIVSSVEEKN